MIMTSYKSTPSPDRPFTSTGTLAMASEKKLSFVVFEIGDFPDTLSFLVPQVFSHRVRRALFHLSHLFFALSVRLCEPACSLRITVWSYTLHIVLISINLQEVLMSSSFSLNPMLPLCHPQHALHALFKPELWVEKEVKAYVVYPFLSHAVLMVWKLCAFYS